MQKFRWKTLNQEGQTITGEMYAGSQAEAGQKLLLTYPYVLELKPVFQWKLGLGRRRNLTDLERETLYRQLAILLEGGIPSLRAVHVLGLGKSQKLQDLCQALEQDLQAGFSLSQTLQKHWQQAGSLAPKLVAAGEESGKVPETLQGLADFYGEQRENKKAVIQACMYPGLVFLLSLCIALYFAWAILPIFMDVYQLMRLEPTPLLVGVLNLRNLAAEYPPLVFLFLAGLGWCGTQLLQGKGGFWHKLPILASLYHDLWEVRYSRLLSLLLASGLTLDKALTAAGAILPEEKLRTVSRQLEQEVIAGMSLHGASENHPQFFGSLTREFIAIGEESGKLPEMLGEAAALMEKELRSRLKNLKTLLEPCLLLLLAGGSAALLYLVLSPMYTIMNRLPAQF